MTEQELIQLFSNKERAADRLQQERTLDQLQSRVDKELSKFSPEERRRNADEL